MKISVLGTGDVGRTLSSAFMKKGHDVTMGTRNTEEKLAEQSTHDQYKSFGEWYKENKEVKLVTFSESASEGEIVINATNGVNSLNALDLAGEENLSGKILIDISNPLEYSNGIMSLVDGLNNTNSLGEEIQKEFPEARVVKTFNTMWCGLMVNPGLIKGNHINFISGNDQEAKAKVKDLIKEFGWKDENIIDLGDISAARAQESVLLIWARLWSLLKTGAFNFSIAR
jgi:predicted dinucleotide-binding enzyme